jgi:hypothetical protein
MIHIGNHSVSVQIEIDGRKFTCDTPAEAAELFQLLSSAPARPRRTEQTARYFDAADQLRAGRFKTITEAAASVTVSIKAMQRLLWATNMIAPEHRHLKLTTEHHMKVAGIKPACSAHLNEGYSKDCPACEMMRVAHIDRWLEQAERSGWNTKKLEDEVRKEYADRPSVMGHGHKGPQTIKEPTRSLSLVGPKTATP